jgi:hypothetical protein
MGSSGTATGSGFLQPWLPAKATHYGPFPARPWLSESGYQESEAGVGCSNGQPGGDPRWRAILASQGTHNRSEVVQMGLLSRTSPTTIGLKPPLTESDMASVITTKGLDRLVWPRAYTVAVSERAFGGSNKNKICFQTVQVWHL